ncbi:MAG: bifunctional nuclease family protein [Planctomycetes bacterium]|nr:bifunctional nuclease family protein [Planctomycetota bacterium]
MDQPVYHLVKVVDVSLSNMGFAVILKKNTADERILPIFIGAAEAHSIAMVHHGQSYPRPLSHDFFKNVLDALNMKLSHVHICDLQDGTFYARVFLEDGETGLDIDSRPSDAIALALRYEAPIYVHEDVFEQSAVSVDPKDASEDAGESRVEDLKNQMDAAIAEERYEDAARFRDELKLLSNDN